MNNLEKGNSGKGIMGKDKSGNEKYETWQFWKGASEKGRSGKSEEELPFEEDQSHQLRFQF